MRQMMTVIVALSLAVGGASAKTHKKPKPDTEPDKPQHFAVLDHISDLCTTEGAFGRKFSRQRYGETDTTPDEDWSPFEHLTLRYNEIRAEADLRGTSDSQEGDEAAAKKLLTALEKDVTGFAHHEKHSNGSEYHSGEKKGADLSLTIRQDEEHLTVTCRNEDR